MTRYRYYIAGTFSTEESKSDIKNIISLICETDRSLSYDDLYIPMDYKVPGDYIRFNGEWVLPNNDWARDVFYTR